MLAKKRFPLRLPCHTNQKKKKRFACNINVPMIRSFSLNPCQLFFLLHTPDPDRLLVGYMTESEILLLNDENRSSLARPETTKQSRKRMFLGFALEQSKPLGIQICSEQFHVFVVYCLVSWLALLYVSIVLQMTFTPYMFLLLFVG